MDQFNGCSVECGRLVSNERIIQTNEHATLSHDTGSATLCFARLKHSQCIPNLIDQEIRMIL